MKHIFLFILFTLIGLGLFFAYHMIKSSHNLIPLKENQVISTPFSMKDAPKKTVRGTITLLTGDAFWQSRTATAPSQITTPQPVQQGESLSTGENETIAVDFVGMSTLTISPKSAVDIIQTLPSNFVFSQSKGKVSYTRVDTTPVSIRSLHLLTLIDDGTVTLSFNEDNPLVTVSLPKGAVRVAYNDLNNVSHVVTLGQNQQFFFNDSTRQLE